MLMNVIMIIQLAATIVVGIYFFRQLRAQSAPEKVIRNTKGQAEWNKLNSLRQIHLTEPLNEQVRPAKLEDVVGQEAGIDALMAVLSGPNPQHVIIYGPPGVGKTCAARLALEAAKQSEGTPFAMNAPFIEMDATCVRFDERAIADPLIGSVHDPIYQGAGQLGISGVPQPKEGAVTRAHGGVLFLDEIGELHPLQMNKLLKVLEDRKVRFESAYYNRFDSATPGWIHDVFQNGMPADFRLVGATTRSPEDIPPALRSRCMEIFFRPLDAGELAGIAGSAAERAGFPMAHEDAELVGSYAANGRDAVNIVQMAMGIARRAGRRQIQREDILWVVDCGRYTMRHEAGLCRAGGVGIVHGLAVHGAGQGAVMEIEATKTPGTGRVTVTGIVEEEEFTGGHGHKMRRMSMARGAAENAYTLIKSMGYPTEGYDLHINFPGGVPVDGPSAGVAMAVAMVSVLTEKAVASDVAITGEVSVRGRVLPVGGVNAKAQAAARAKLARVIIPKDNASERIQAEIEICPVEEIEEVFKLAFGEETEIKVPLISDASVLAAQGE
ncbi:MAG: ATP-dependent protease LonB [Clostridiales bacterium]|nr:ATP-dependent protease LonB [Clostridiales bacterium]